MASERIQRQIDRLLNEADEAVLRSDWALARDRAQNVLAFDPENSDARAYLTAADRALGASLHPLQKQPSRQKPHQPPPRILSPPP